MQKAIIIFVVLLVSLGATSVYAQQSAIDRHFQEYRLDDRYTHVSVSSKMFDLFLNFEREDPSEQELIEIIGKLKGLKVLVGESIENAADEFKNISAVPYSDMEELMEIAEVNKEFVFFITEKSGKISELLMVGYEGDHLFMLSLIGDIDLKEIAQLSKKMNIEGFEHFENINQ